MTQLMGYQDRVLRIDLTNKRATFEPLRRDFVEKYVGSKGLAIRYMYEELAEGINPLGPENKLFLTTGPMTGTPIPCSGKLSVAAKSPATGTMNDCSIGGHVGVKVKFAGYDMIIFEGVLDKPGVVMIDNGDIRFIDGDEYWGRGAHETETALTKKYGREFSYMTIGPGGENLSNMACINSDYYRQAGRGGIGAVMGSKKMKAIMIRGTRGFKNVPNIVETTKRINEILRESCVTEDNQFIFDEGTTAFVEACNDGGILPWKNFSDTTDAKWEEYGPGPMLEKREGKRGCGSCGLGCGNFIRIGDAVCEGPEYETISVAGPNSGSRDTYQILRFNQVCDDMGLDTISTGDTIVWAMEMTEKGLHDFGIRFGESYKMPEMVEDIAYRRGDAAFLADGVKKASEKWGGTEFAMQVKGLEYPQYEPRGSWGMALSYAISDRGACHMRSYAANAEVFEASVEPYTPEGKGQVVFDLYKYNAAKFSMCLCDLWTTVDFDIISELLSLITGKEWTADDIDALGARVVNIARAFNQREGFNRQQDTVPKRVISEALKNGPAAGHYIPPEAFESMLDQYYEVMGWDKNGMMPQELIDSLL